jgi:hypothetical protein
VCGLSKKGCRVMTLHCHACGHQWELVLTLPMPCDRAILVMRGAVAAGCPACGLYDADNIRVGPITLPTIQLDEE